MRRFVLKPILGLVLAACLSAGVAQAAEAPFIGTWKLDPARSRLPDAMKVQRRGDATYAFDFGGGLETVVVNGRDQKGVDGTLLSVRPVATDTWIVERKQGGRLLLRATWKLSKDGRRLTDYFRQFGSDGATQGTDYVYQRTDGGTGFAGDWRSIKETMKSPTLLQVKPFQGDGLSFISLTSHVTRNVKFDGADYPDEGQNARPGASSSVRRVDQRTLAITGKYAGKVTFTEDVGLSPDLKTLTLTQHIPGHDRPNVLVFRRT